MRCTVTLDDSSVLMVSVNAPETALVHEVAERLREHWQVSGEGWRLEPLGFAASGRRIQPQAPWGTVDEPSLLLSRRPGPRPSASALRMNILTGPDSGRVIPVGAGAWRVGRGTGNDIVIHDPLLSRGGRELLISPRGVEDGERFHGLGEVFGLGASTFMVHTASGTHPRVESLTVQPPEEPRPTEPRRLYIAGLLAPLVVAGVLVAVTKMWLFLLITLASPITGFFTWWFERRHARLTTARDAAAWREAEARSRARVTAALDGFRASSYASRRGCFLGLGNARAPVTIQGEWPTAPPDWSAPELARTWSPMASGAGIHVDIDQEDIVIRGPLGAALDVARHAISTLRPDSWEAATSRPADFAFLGPYGLAVVDPESAVGDGRVRLIDQISGHRRELTIAGPRRTHQERPKVLVDLSPSGSVGVDNATLTAAPSSGTVSGQLVPGAMSASAWLAHRPAASAAEQGSGCQAGALEGLVDLGVAALQHRWARRLHGLPVVLGRTPDGAATVDLVRDGPHVLVGGTTGSGKSQFLETLAVGLAAEQSPRALNLLLIDFKGGAAFRRIAELPHVAGMLTNLDAHATERAIRALDAELQRRQRLFASVDAKDLDEFRALSPIAAAVPPRLVVIVDEFRAMSQALPDLLEHLVSLAGLGRSLGMHLVLATQRPAGVVSADMRANLGLRVALRMRDTGDSLDVLESGVAASISAALPGRGYFRSDAQSEREFHAALVAGVGEATSDTITIGPARGPAIAPVEPGSEFSVASFLAAAGDARAEPLWLPELPDLLDVDAAKPWAAALADRPEVQCQDWLDLADGDHIGLVGSPRSGRSRAMATLLRSAAHRRPDSSWYVLDLDRQLGYLEDHEQCLGRFTSDEPWRIDRMFSRLIAEVRERQESGRATPRIELAIDGWDGVLTLADENRRDWADKVLTIARTGGACGIRLLVTGDRRLMTSRLGQALGTVLIFRMNDPGDLVFLGLPKSALPQHMPPGRALITGNLAGPPVEVQFVSDERIPAVPDASERKPMRPLPRAAEAPGPISPETFPLGLGGDAAEPQSWRFGGDGPTLFVAAPAGSAYLGDYWRRRVGDDTDGHVIELAGLSRADHTDVLASLREQPERRRILTAPLDSLMSGSPLITELNYRGPRLLLGASNAAQGELVGRRDLCPMGTLPGRGWFLRGAGAIPLQLYRLTPHA